MYTYYYFHSISISKYIELSCSSSIYRIECIPITVSIQFQSLCGTSFWCFYKTCYYPYCLLLLPLFQYTYHYYYYYSFNINYSTILIQYTLIPLPLLNCELLELIRLATTLTAYYYCHSFSILTTTTTTTLSI